MYFLDEENFCPGAAEYFMFWTSLMTVELITEVQEVETSFLHQRELCKAQILVEEEQQGKEMVLKVKILTENYCFSFVLMLEKVKWALSIPKFDAKCFNSLSSDEVGNGRREAAIQTGGCCDDLQRSQ